MLLSGAGRAFSVGADLKEIAEHMADPVANRAVESSGFVEFIGTGANAQAVASFLQR